MHVIAYIGYTLHTFLQKEASDRQLWVPR